MIFSENRFPLFGIMLHFPGARISAKTALAAAGVRLPIRVCPMDARSRALFLCLPLFSLSPAGRGCAAQEV
jgi:hypothetical protein